MDSSGEGRATTDSDWQVTSPHVALPPAPRRPVHPLRATRRLTPALTAIVGRFERATTLHTALIPLQYALTIELEVPDVLVVWMDWPRRIAWSCAGRVSPRLQELTPHVAGGGRRAVLENAILEPIGPAPARAVLILRGKGERLFQPLPLRMLPRIAAGIAPALDRLLVHHRATSA